MTCGPLWTRQRVYSCQKWNLKCKLQKPCHEDSVRKGHAGFIKQRSEVLANQTMSASYRASIGYPICFCHPDGTPYDAQGQMDAVIEMMPDGKGQVSLVELTEPSDDT